MNFVKISGGSKPYRDMVVSDMLRSPNNSYAKFENPSLSQVKHALSHYGGTTTCIFVDPEPDVEQALVSSTMVASVVLVAP